MDNHMSVLRKEIREAKSSLEEQVGELTKAVASLTERIGALESHATKADSKKPAR